MQYSFLLHNTSSITKATLFLFRGFLTIFCLFVFLKGRTAYQPLLLTHPGSLPILPPPQVSHIQPHHCNTAARRMEQVTGSQEGECFKALDLFLPPQKCLWFCPFLSSYAAAPFIQALLLPVPRPISLSMASSLHLSSTTELCLTWYVTQAWNPSILLHCSLEKHGTHGVWQTMPFSLILPPDSICFRCTEHTLCFPLPSLGFPNLGCPPHHFSAQ